MTLLAIQQKMDYIRSSEQGEISPKWTFQALMGNWKNTGRIELLE